jgi:hypothetical protein
LRSWHCQSSIRHHLYESIKQVFAVLRTGAGFRVALEAKSRNIRTRHTLNSAIEKRFMSAPKIGRQIVSVDGEPVILTGNHDYASRKILYRMISAMMSVGHFHGLGTTGKR